MEKLSLQNNITNGKIAAAFISASAAIISLGVMTFFRQGQSWLEVYKPAAVYSGIFLYSEAMWIGLWIILYVLLRNKQNIGNIKIWAAVFIGSLILCNIFIHASLKWTPLW